MSAELLLEATTLSGAGSQIITKRLPKAGAGRSLALQIDTDGTLTLGAVTIEVRNAHSGAVNGGGWIDFTAELDLYGDDLTAGQGAAGYNVSFLAFEEIRVTIPWDAGSGDVSLTLHAVA